MSMAQAPHFHTNEIPAQGLPSCVYLPNIHMHYITHTQMILDKRQHSLGSTQDSPSIHRLFRIEAQGYTASPEGSTAEIPLPSRFTDKMKHVPIRFKMAGISEMHGPLP